MIEGNKDVFVKSKRGGNNEIIRSLKNFFI